ncbi:hypothetical protein D918_07932 [Trichuris suis]|nr:hypothetical protein D918_07932 [Trichuris suis]
MALQLKMRQSVPQDERPIASQYDSDELHESAEDDRKQRRLKCRIVTGRSNKPDLISRGDFGPDAFASQGYCSMSGDALLLLLDDDVAATNHLSITTK